MPVRRPGARPLSFPPAHVEPRPRAKDPKAVGVVEPARRQVVTLEPKAQPLSSDDVYLRGTGPGWVDPEAASAHRAARVASYTGPLFKDEPTFDDVQQGELGDCYFCAALAGIAAANPQAIKDLIRPAADGSADVRFFERDVVTGELRPVVVHVDAELYESWRGPLYGHSTGDRGSMELWFALVEKAWATLRGGYERVGAGGVQNQVFEAVLGRPAGWLALDGATAPDAVWGTMVATLQAGQPLGAATQSLDDGRYANTGVHANHGYTVLAATELAGERVVTLRNPWGQGEPRGDGVDDGVFRLPFDEFLRLYGQLQFGLI